MTEFECPKCHGRTCRRWALPHPLLLHCIVNPGLVVNELVLGQCLPREVFICTSCPAPFMERQYVHCPSCNVFHSDLLWGKRNAFGHWFGLVCPSCGAAIPRLWNIVSLLVLGVTLPVWWFPVRAWKLRYLDFERRRAAAALAAGTEACKPNWLRMGLEWGIFTGISFSLMFPLVAPHHDGYLVEVGACALFFPIWLVGGLVFGFFMKVTMLHRPG